MNTHWAARSQHWGQMGPPLQPNHEVLDFMLSLVPRESNIMLLGVTPQIAQKYTSVVAVDYSEAMIQRVWPGNSNTKRAILCNWLEFTPNNKFDAILGDGSINMLQHPREVQNFFSRLSLWLKPDAPLVCRIFTRFDEPVTLDRIHSELHTNRNFAAWRRLLNMYLAEQKGPLVKHSDTLDLFNELFPDRSKLPWTSEQCAKLDAYRNTDTYTWFPRRDEFLQLIPSNIHAQFTDVGTYEHATAYPILTCKIQDPK